MSCWMDFHMDDTSIHMKTTLTIPDRVFAEIKREAARRHSTISAVVEAALRLYLQRGKDRPSPLELPILDGGRLLVDVSDREKLDELFDAEERDR
jgi:Ribbon-helix-helix protein, copG family